MKRQKLKDDPHRLNEFQWWYEEKEGITVVAEARKPDGTHLATEQVSIPWQVLLSAASRAGKL